MAEVGGERIPSTAEFMRRVREATQVKVRYGRATLTIGKTGSMLRGPVSQALAAHRKGESSAEDVAWAFIKARVYEESPTFDWGAVELSKLLPRITAATREPEIEAETPEALIPELEAIEAEELESAKKIQERLNRQMEGLSTRWKKQFETIDRTAEMARLAQFGKPPRISEIPGLISPPKPVKPPVYPDPAKGVWSSYERAMNAARPNTRILGNLGVDWKALNALLAPKATLADFGIDRRAYEGFLKAASGPPALEPQPSPLLESWRMLVTQVAGAARGADSPEVAEAVEATVEEVVEPSDSIDISAITERLDLLIEIEQRQAEEQQRLAEEVQRLAGEQEKTSEEQKRLADDQQRLAESSSWARMMIVGLAIQLIFYLIQFYLAKFGIKLPEPPPGH